jgi:tungstate transport system substrate-binding protein
MRPWALNEHVVVGPKEDPAGIAGAVDGAEAMARIAAAGGPFVANRDPGSHGIVQRLLRRRGTEVSSS